MEEMIKRLKATLTKIYPNSDTGFLGYWAVGSEEVWKVNDPADASDATVFRAEIRNGIWMIQPATGGGAKRISVSFRISTEIAEQLKSLSDITGKSQTGIVEELIATRWNEAQK